MKTLWNWWSAKKVGLILIIFALGIGIIYQVKFQELSANLVAELGSIAVTILIIDALNDKRFKEELKQRLIREMGSNNNADALRAVRELRAHGWLEDGSLNGANLEKSNLENADLTKANLKKANLKYANLRGANLTLANFEWAKLFQANLEFSDGSGINLTNADLATANLNNANFRGAKLINADLKETRLDNANFMKANIKGANVRNEQLRLTKNLKFAILPDGTTNEDTLIEP